MVTNNSSETANPVQLLFADLFNRLSQIGNLNRELTIFDVFTEQSADYFSSILSSKIYNYPPDELIRWIDHAILTIHHLVDKDNNLVSSIKVITPTNELADKMESDIARQFELQNLKKELLKYLNGLNELRQQVLPLLAGLKPGPPIIELPENFLAQDLARNNLPPTILDKYQTALLFHLMKEGNVIVNLSDKTLSKICQTLTGHSANKLRTECFGKIWDVIKDKAVNKEEAENTLGHNLKSVKQVLLQMVFEIDRLIEENELA